jgi:hypothetical protein
MDTTPSQDADDEVTRICPYPGCIHFSDHEGDHEFPPIVDAKPSTESEEKPKRPKKKMQGQDAILPDNRPKPNDAQGQEPGAL